VNAAAPSTVVRSAWTLLVVIVLFVLRVHDIGHHFWLMGDQIRDWNIALGSFTSLPLVGPPTHVWGYTIGPAFYWVLWALRVVTGPFFHNLPHGGGIGQAALESAADALLLIAIWRRTGSGWIAAAIIILAGTAPYDLALAATIWNPVVGSLLARTAIALILLAWPGESLVRIGIVTAIAWCAVQAYTGAVFIALSVFAALLVEAALARRWTTVARRLAVIACVVIALQIPWLVDHARHPGETGMTVVTDGLFSVLSGHAAPRLGVSAVGLVRSVVALHGLPGPLAIWVTVLVLGAIGLAIGHRTDIVLLSMTLLPLVLAVVGYSFWFFDLEAYFYLSIAPTAVMTVVLGAAALLPARRRFVVGLAFAAAGLAMMPARVAQAAPLCSLPQYRALAAGALLIADSGRVVRWVEADFELPPTCNAEFLYLVVGGSLDPSAEWGAVILRDGQVEYRRATSPAP
jgi:hypothetical protein